MSIAPTSSPSSPRRSPLGGISRTLRHLVIFATLSAVVLGSLGARGAHAADLGPQTTPLTPSAVDFGVVGPGTTLTSSTQFDATDSGTLVATSPNLAVFTVTSIDTYQVSDDQVDTSGDLLPGRGSRGSQYERVLTFDQHLDGPGPVAVTKGERVVVGLSATAPSSTAGDGLHERLAVTDGGSEIDVPLAINVGDVQVLPTNWPVFHVHPGDTINAELDVLTASGPSAGVEIGVSERGNPFGLISNEIAVQLPAIQSRPALSLDAFFITVVVQPGATNYSHVLLVTASVYGITRTIGSIAVVVSR